MRTIKITETDLKRIVSKVLQESHDGKNNRYMFFQNLKQMKRQCDLLLNLDESTVSEILDNGHDWADDHITESKNNLDQVFDFLMNEIHGEDIRNMDFDVEVVEEGKKELVQNYAQGVRRRPKQNSKYIPQHTPTGTQYRYVKVRCLVLTGKNIVQVPIASCYFEIYDYI